MNTGNQNARAGGSGAGKDSRQQNQSQTPGPGNKDYENRRNAAACFKNKDKAETWQSEFTGVMVTEDLPMGTKVWVNIYERTDRYGTPYLSVVLKRFQRR
jgi:hypothetical protein